jgi:Spy/CpxP family protein refolding chaperone
LWEGAWWNSPIVRNLDLTEAQRKDIRGTVREYRGHLLDLREAVQRADGDLEIALGENPLDQRKANEAIEHLATARADLTRTLSQMTLRLRAILTSDQWQELQRRQARRRAVPFRGRGEGSPPPAARQR